MTSQKNDQKPDFSANILVVDDNDANLRLLGEILKERGHKIRLVREGKFAIKSAVAEPPDLILLNIMMPGVDGAEVCSQLKANPKTKNIPVIVLSAKGEVFDKVKGFAVGGVDYITKPFVTEEAVARIENQLKIWRLSQELREQNHLLQEELKQLQRAGVELANSNCNPVELEELRRRVNQRIDLLNQANDRLQQEIAIREKELRERSQLERELMEQNERLQATEKTASRREREFRALVENAPDLILRVDRQCRYLYVNPTFAREAGKSAAEIVGKTIRELETNPELVSLWEKTVADVFETGAERGFEFDIPAKGAVKYYSARVVPEWGEAAAVESVLAVVRDFGDRKRTEEKIRLLLRASQAIHHAADVDSALVAILDLIRLAIDWTWGEAWKLSQDGAALISSGACYGRDSSITQFQQSTEAIVFAPGEGLPGRVWSTGKSEWLQGIDTLDEKVFLRQEAAAAVGLKTGLGVPVIADGRAVAVLVFFNEAPLPKDSQLIELVEAIAFQLGGAIETKQAQQAVIFGEERLQLAVEGSELGIWDWNVQTGETYYSFQWKKMLGYEDEEIKNTYRAWAILVHPDDLPGTRKALNACLRGEVPIYEAEFRMRSRSGKWKWILARGKLVEWNSQGEPLRMAGINKDISDRKEAEIALAGQVRREKLVSAILERIRSSLNLEEILKTAAEEIRKFLNGDRVLIYQVLSGNVRSAIVESVAPGLNCISGSILREETFPWETYELYCKGEIFAVEDIATAEISPSQAEFLRQSGIRAKLGIPILKDGELWGLIAIHQCLKARRWQAVELESLKQICVQLAIAIQQSTLYEQAQAEIWERTAAEKALRESQRFVQQIADTSPNLLYIFDMEEQHNVYTNRELAEILGYTPEQIRGIGDKLLSTIVHPEDLALLAEHYENIYSAKNNEILEYKYRARSAKGEWRYLLARETIFARTPEGKPKQVLGTASDITTLKETEAALREVVEREKTLAFAFQRIRRSLDLDTIFAAATEELRLALQCERAAIYCFNADYTGEYVAESVIKKEFAVMLPEATSPGRSLRIEPDENNYLDTFLKSPQKWYDSYLKETEAGVFKSLGKYCLVTADIYEKNFSDCYLEQLVKYGISAYIIVPIFCGSKLWGLLAAYQHSGPRQWKRSDEKITAEIGHQLGVAIQQAELLEQTKKQSESLERAAIAADAANRAKSEFLANMSHELRTPLNAILGYTQLMNRDRSLSPQHQKQLKTIDRAGEHLLALINDILEMSKIEAGRITLNENRFNLISMLENLESMLELKAQSKGLQLRFELAPELPPVIEADEGKLRQILINILGNAIKFTKQGWVVLRAKVEKSEPPYFQLRFEIEDTGPGIAPEEMDRLFEPFAQTKTGRESLQGTGLGLPISRKFVQKMGGDIQASSILDKGSTFSFDIGIIASDARECRDELSQRRAIALADTGKTYRILVADDLANNRQFLVALLTSLGFEVGEAENGREALSLWSSWEPHLILMDMRMPVMDGYEATKRIKASETGRRTIVIALTATAFEEDCQKTLVAGCDDFLRKPFREEVLLEKIAEHLGIEYIYEEDDAASQGSNKTSEKISTTSDIIQYLSEMPENWVVEVRHAASQGTEDAILELLERVPVEQAPLAKALEDLANEFQFEVIMELTEMVNC